MKLEKIWDQFDPRQFEYLANIVANSTAKSVIDVGCFCGSVGRAVWKGIEDTDKELYLLDNFKFLPEKFRPHFFKAVKKTIGESDRIHTILEDSHRYPWQQHDFVIFSHADYDHMKIDFEKLLDAKIKFIALDLPLNCFQRTSTMLEAISNNKLIPRYYIDGMLICGDETPCTLPTHDGKFLGHDIKWVEKKKGSYVKAVEDIVKNL